jgi:hypothetical protein
MKLVFESRKVIVTQALPPMGDTEDVLPGALAARDRAGCKGQPTRGTGHRGLLAPRRPRHHLLTARGVFNR